MASSPITSWKTEGEKVEVVTDFLFLGSNITVLESWLQSWNQNSIASWQESCEKPRRCVENQRHHSADKGPYSQGSGLPSDHVWLWELDCKEGKMSKNWCLLTVALEKLLKVPWRSNQSILREINPEYWLEILMLKLKLQSFGHLMWTTDSLEKSLIWERLRAKGEESVRGWDAWMASLMQWTWTRTNFGRWWGTERPSVLQSMGSQRVGHDWVTQQQPEVGQDEVPLQGTPMSSHTLIR